jgi:DNA polymerase-1
MAYLLEPTETGYDLKRMSEKYLGAELHGSLAVFSLAPVLRKRLEAEGMAELYSTVELPLCRVLADMEREGFMVDRLALSQFGKLLSLRIDELQSEICSFPGAFNINSPMQRVRYSLKSNAPRRQKDKTVEYQC